MAIKQVFPRLLCSPSFSHNSIKCFILSYVIRGWYNGPTCGLCTKVSVSPHHKGRQKLLQIIWVWGLLYYAVCSYTGAWRICSRTLGECSERGPRALKNVTGSEYVLDALLFIRTNEDRKYTIFVAPKSPRGPTTVSCYINCIPSSRGALGHGPLRLCLNPPLSG